MSFTAKEVLTRAASQIGYTEHKDNITKFSAEFGVKVAQWCGYFVDYIIKQSGGKEPKVHYTPAGAEGYRSLHRFMTVGDPKPGDLIFMDFPHDGIDRISHIGICITTMHDGSVLCIEGNTSPNEAGDQRNGGCVQVKKRNRKVIVGWGRPHYDPSDTAPIVNDLVARFRNNDFPKPYPGDLGKPATPKAAAKKAPAKKPAPKGKK